ncbi:phytanoyl-CoA dioxygenase family protein [Flavobacterium sp. NRK1]|uniref:phytanoyl-CoA dioxygenase family protein n=1 Tax=Flavobacterium sp. NRK1 TaxID=2954929 RepID=UPI0020936A70|nr:phytanoyl-CoA dioxygenase family protein [Flavobacterium sp. NRK1]MCO6146693.1 phytanoyl-CoA dioxygenase family protein [Flavobacterium sp. NRK1]
MPYTILENLWRRTLNPQTAFSDNNNAWNRENETLYKMGISMEDTLKYLYFEKPDLDSFKAWIAENKKFVAADDREFIDDVLTKDDLEFWDKNGYVIVKEAISKQECEETTQAIWEFLKMSPDNSASWYKPHEDLKGLMLSFFDHAALNKNRESKRIKKAYEQLYKTNRIFKTIDKVSFNPPETKNFHFKGSPLHWDISLKMPAPFGLQGLLYLTDCDAHDGAFHCVPGFHKKIESWLKELSPDENPRSKALEVLHPAPVTGNAGDFIIWQNTLPHCASPNNGKVPRMVQYLTYLPDDYITPAEWI